MSPFCFTNASCQQMLCGRCCALLSFPFKMLQEDDRCGKPQADHVREERAVNQKQRRNKGDCAHLHLKDDAEVIDQSRDHGSFDDDGVFYAERFCHNNGCGAHDGRQELPADRCGRFDGAGKLLGVADILVADIFYEGDGKCVGGGVSLHYGVLHGDCNLRIAVLHQLDVCAGRVCGFHACLIVSLAQCSVKCAINGGINAGGGASRDCNKLFGALSFSG